ncbi:serine hydrolase domain-containing protein [Flavobacterium lindanitolerans]|uniref:CubicO group peptidase (Beta-lactamase class C family) n=1 Tax=Flavobacterium lindanitolerans TaxID=428988 RepID=A0A497U1G5_9FLAO|nr:serine hydrolase domain-containing protein [Flavobacterium lindanitolerans]PKW20416.1 CubicO group peptidase (beta-lactamase class C family) [Flavobacterium lindanitolerans]RLJ23627.1 CubicO group peptidase (beta-lactamase class C family) [Flavobacterium lindanitolerans]
MKKLLATALLLLFISAIVQAQDFTRKTDNMISNVFKDKNGPGGVFLVAKNGKTIYHKAVGKANLELDVDMTADQIFQIGSITKQFTAVGILMLEEQGKINTGSSISKYIPDYPSGDNIKIYHLLTHTSGIKDFTKMKSIQQIAQKDLSPKELIDFFKNEPVEFLPGTKFEYNNSGYAILGYIIELVTGETYRDFIRKNIFEKIGMVNSRYADDSAIIKKRAYGYQKKGEAYVNKGRISFAIPYSSGSLMSTSEDMLKWQNALNHNLLLNEKTSEKAFTKKTLDNGETIGYGFGWHLSRLNGIATREHGGSVFGFKSMGVYIPDEDIYVIGFSNCDCNSPTQLVRDIASEAWKTFKSKP